MAAKQSAEVQRAMQFHLEAGKSIYESARLAGVWPSTLYRALKNKAKSHTKKRVDRGVA